MSDAIKEAIEAMDKSKPYMSAYSPDRKMIDKAIAALQALQGGEPVVPSQWRVVMRGMVEYAECNDPGNPYLPQAQALLSAGKGTV